MRETTTGTPDASSHRNMASAHDYVNDTIRPIPRYATDNIGPAGAMYSSVSDMAIWMRFLLDSTRLGSKRMLSPRGYADLFAPHMLVDEKQFYPTAKLTHPHFQGYVTDLLIGDLFREEVDQVWAPLDAVKAEQPKSAAEAVLA